MEPLAGNEPARQRIRAGVLALVSSTSNAGLADAQRNSHGEHLL